MKKIILTLLLVGFMACCAAKKVPVAPVPELPAPAHEHSEAEIQGCLDKCVQLCEGQPVDSVFPIVCGEGGHIVGECGCH